jgi:hypothetical protein
MSRHHDPFIEHEQLSQMELEDPNFQIRKTKATIYDNCYDTDKRNEIEFKKTKKFLKIWAWVHGHKKVAKQRTCDLGHDHIIFRTEKKTMFLTEIDRKSAVKLARWILNEWGEE